MVEVGSNLRSKIERDAIQTAAGRLKTEDFRSDPRSGSSARGFIGFGEEEGRDDRVVSEGLRKISQADRASNPGRVCNERTELRSSMNLG